MVSKQHHPGRRKPWCIVETPASRHALRATHRPGAAAIEMAILLPLLVLIFVIATDFVRLYFYSVTVTNCARSGALYGCMSTAQSTNTTGIKTAALKDASNLGTQPTVSSTTGKDASGNPYVAVTVTYTFKTVTGYTGVAKTFSLSRTVQMRVVPTTPSN